ncbi:hypothetical protein ACJX0J_035823 [Zea mays]
MQHITSIALSLSLLLQSIGGWEVPALIFMYTLYTKSLYQVEMVFLVTVNGLSYLKKNESSTVFWLQIIIQNKHALSYNENILYFGSICAAANNLGMDSASEGL